MTVPPSANPRTYDLCIKVVGRRLYWRNRNSGVTLGPDCIAWTMDGAAHEVPYGNIVAVHLNSAGQKITEDRCAMTFADGSGLRIVNTDPGGYADAARAAAYRDFVRDLHARLEASGNGAVRFTAGVAPWRYCTMLVGAAAAATVFTIAGLAGYFIFHQWSGLVLLGLGLYFSWTLGRRALANAPRDYTPEHLPERLLS
jgi:hypothetical protein